MISTKTNSGKLPLPDRKYKGGIRTFAAHPATLNAAAIEAGKIIGDLPESLDRKKHPELNRPRPNAGTVAALAAQIQDPEKRAAVEKVEAEKTAKRSTKRAVKAEKKKATADGATKAMPLTGKAAVKAIRKAVKATVVADDKSGGKAAVRAAAKKVVSEVKAKKAPGKRATGYDWDGAKLQAKTGTVPPTPPFTSYGPHMKKAHDMAKAGQAKELREYLKGFTSDPCPPSRKNLFRYGELCLAAMKGAAAGGTGKDA